MAMVMNACALLVLVIFTQYHAEGACDYSGYPCVPEKNCFFEEEMTIDLDKSGEMTKPMTGITVVSGVSNPINGRPCSRQVVLKVNFERLDPCSPEGCRKDCYIYRGRRMLKVEMFYGSPISGWTFNIGDSPQNDGYAGDYGYTMYDAEVQGLNNNVQVYKNDHCGSGQLPAFSPPVLGSGVTKLTAWVANEYLKLGNNLGFCFRTCDKCLFGLNGQDVSPNPNTDIHVAGNRVINLNGHPDRVGSGLCRMRLSWVNSPEE